MIELVSGSEVIVLHPEAVVTRSGAAVYFAPDGAIALFDAESVIKLADLRPQSAA